ncbi:aminotransferase class I/II-fold pyridoxal phosphate-dependent enzyme [Propionispora hippei]|uniref:8-amino-7-oxononanoate synthase n=1 Tax=Propionispora hippei DSM 15287 TaxID=1123003 RepID=A0A1M6MV00_9FIRM|nr:aminotransferase class I/II-fold pyridoxal phosphate-dependent enzyme [Propionispora hippei]SHJ87277.1 glycine C-acetyltransferase [Propionispora hippei DSM 15287]
MQAAKLYGTGAGGARLTTGTYPLLEQLEKELAIFKETQASLLFNTGYMANIGVISSLAGPEDVIFSDQLNHASIIDGCRLSRAKTVIYRHKDMEDLYRLLKDTPCTGNRFIITDGVFSMDGDISPLNHIVDLAQSCGAIVMVDDAHATGVLGAGGKGSASYFGLTGQVHIQIGTLSKALGAEGGFVAGSSLLIEYIKNTARSFIFSTAPAPAAMGGALAALRRLVAEPQLVERLFANARYVREGLREAGVPLDTGTTPIIPIMLGEAEKAVWLMNKLKRSGIIVTAIRPPSVPDGTSRLRLTVSAVHERNQLSKAVESIKAAYRKMNK